MAVVLAMVLGSPASPAGGQAGPLDEIEGLVEHVSGSCGLVERAVPRAGACKWQARYRGTGLGNDAARTVAVSPDGSRVFVAGVATAEQSNRFEPGVGAAGATVAYDAVTGEALWETNLGLNGINLYLIEVSPDGLRVYVAGWHRPSGTIVGNFASYLTVALDAGTGRVLWTATYTNSPPQGDPDGPSHSGNDRPAALAVSPDGQTVFVTGTSTRKYQTLGQEDYATVAYHALTGLELWVARYNGPASTNNQVNDAAWAIGVSPDGSKVFVTGGTLYSGTTSNERWAFGTVAYDAGDGTELWVATYTLPGLTSQATALGVAPDGAAVYVTGWSAQGQDGRSPTNRDYATVAYDAADGSELWVARYDGPASLNDIPAGLRVSPDGSAVFVTGESRGSGTWQDYATVAYDAADGSELWVARYDGEAGLQDHASALDVASDGATVIVTGESREGSSFWSAAFATVAYDASSGAERWTARYAGPAGTDGARDIAVGPDGARVFVTGTSFNGVDSDFATLAYDVGDGGQAWLAVHDGPRDGHDRAAAIGVSPDGAALFVTGSSTGHGTGLDYATVAYDALTGTERWAARYDGPVSSDDAATALTVSPDGATVYVTGQSLGSGTSWDYATVAYDAATGAEQWVARYNGPGNGSDVPVAMGVSPDGLALFVTGTSRGSGTLDDYATVAYDATTGAKLWVARYDGPGNHQDAAAGLAMSPDGAAVFVTGESRSGTSSDSGDYATIAYDAVTGAELWVARYDNGFRDRGVALVVDPARGTVVVTGQSQFASAGWDQEWATIVYDAGTGAEQWVARHANQASWHNLDHMPVDVRVTPDGSRIFVAGFAPGTGGYATIAYDSATGNDLWLAHAKTVDGPAYHDAQAMAVSPDGSAVVVTGRVGGSSSAASLGGGYGTLAYDAATGDRLWAATYYGVELRSDTATALAMSPDGSRVFVTGESPSPRSDYATLAYEVWGPLRPIGL